MNYIKLSKRPFSSTENIYHKNNKNNNYKNFISSFNSPSNKDIINSSLNNNNNTYNNYNFNKINNIQSSINRIYLNNNINNKKMSSIKNQLFLNSIDSSVQNNNNNNNKSISIYKKNYNNNNNNNLFHNFNMSSKSINVNKKQSYKSLYNSNIPKFYYTKDKNNISHSHLHTNSNIHSNNNNNNNNNKKAFSMLSLNNRKNSNDSKNSSNTLQVNKKISIRLTKPISNKTLNATNSAINIYNKMNNNNNNVLNNNKINKENIKKFYTNLKKNKLNKINFYNNQYKNKFSINYLANYLKNTVVHKDNSNYININSNNNNNHSNKSISINNYINVGSSYRQNNNNNSKNKKILSTTEKSSPRVSLYNNLNNTKTNREQSNLNNNNNNNENKNVSSHSRIKFSYDLNNKKNENLNVSNKKSIVNNTNLNSPNNYYKNKFNINNNNNDNNNNNKKSIQSKINKIFSQSQKEIFQIKYKHLTSTNSPNKNNLNHINEKIIINKNNNDKSTKNNNNNNKKTFINNYINQTKKITNSNKNSLNQSKNNNLPKNEKEIKEFSKALKINKIVELTKQKNNSAKNLKNINTNSTNTNTDRIEALKNNLLNNNINRRISNQINNNNNNNINNINKENNTTLSSFTHDNNYYFSQYLKLSKFIKNFYKENNEYPNTLLSFYKYGRLIGQGAFGKVNIGLNVLTGRIVAINSFNKQTLLNQGKENKEKILYETDLMRRLNHPNITKILELFETEKYILIILEYINGGNLFSFVKKRRKLNEKTAKFLFKQIIQGIKYIHNNHIVHRDIKLENILIDLNNNIKICDFGIGKILENPNNTILYDQCGTPMYMAPEILLSNRNTGYEAYPVDIWSAGIALYIMLSGTLPFSLSKNNNNNNDSDVISMEGERKNNLALQYSIIHNDPKPVEKISAEAQNLLNGLLNKNPKNRITIDEILNHPWLKNCNEDNNKFNLFTKAEMILLSKTFVDYRFANIENIKENFTLSNLNKDDVVNNYNNNVNIETKSNILAPYNTIRQIFINNNNNNSFDNMNSDFEENEIFNDLKNKEIKIRNGILLFSNKVREFNMNYELNNNGECDNGILINMKTESNFLNSTINNESNLNNNNINENNFEDEFYSENKKKNINEKQREENILNKIENDFGYKKEYVKKSIENNDLNHARAVFYLMMNYEHI